MFPLPESFKSKFASDDYESCSSFTSFSNDQSAQTKSNLTNTSKRSNPDDEDLDQSKKRCYKKISLSIQTVATPGQSSSSQPQGVARILKVDPLENPISIITNLYSDCRFEIIASETNGPLSRPFKATLNVAGRKFVALSHSKKSAKLEASKMALSSLFDLQYNSGKILERRSNKSSIHLSGNQSGGQGQLDNGSDFDIQAHAFDSVLAQSICQTVMEANSEIFEIMKDNNKWSVIASIILTSERDPEWSDLISLTTGTKCIHGDSLSMLGLSLNDCHAEILSRRCFLVYLYDQLTQLIQNEKSGDRSGVNHDDSIIIEKCINRPGYRLKPHIKVNLFISTSPCGDARIFSPSDEKQDGNKESASFGLLRAKIEAGQGTIPVKKNNPLTWDALIQGEQRLRIMSCSDKLALWNVVGLQGSLLSNFLEPIYLDGLIVGSLFSLKHTYRAVSGRLNLSYDSPSLKQLPKLYRLNAPRMASSTMCFSKTRIIVEGNSPSYAINHIKKQPPEIVNTNDGLVIDKTISRISKRALFTKFTKLLELKPSIMSDSLLIDEPAPIIYREAKTASKNYQTAKNRALNAFVEQNLGKWLSAPCEVDLFKLA